MEQLSVTGPTVWKSNESTRGFSASVIEVVVFGLMIKIERPVLLSVSILTMLLRLSYDMGEVQTVGKNQTE